MQVISTGNNTEWARVELSDDRMFAAIAIVDKSDFLDSLTARDLHSLLLSKGVIFGIDDEKLGRIIEAKQWNEPVIVATGIAPQKGNDATLEFLFPTEKSFKPKINDDGSVDYREVSLVHSIEKDAVLITKTPPKPGIDGKTVLGELIPGSPGSDQDITVGKGVYFDPEDENLIRAAVEGVIFYDARRGFLEVQEIYQVNGSVDFATGNLHVKSSVLVRGDVRPGFRITTPYDVEINGVVEHATVECAGALTVHSGITGNGSTTIKVGGDIHSQYIHSQRIHCRGSVYVANELRHADIFCNEEVVVAKSNGVIIGGRISAPDRICAAHIGSVESIPTEIIVGVDSRYQSALLKKAEEKAVAERQLEEIRQQASALIQRSRLGKDDPRFRRFGGDWQALQDKVDGLTRELQQLEELVYGARDPAICVTQKVYPGVTLRIKYATLQIHQEISHAIFKLEDGEIRRY